MSNANDDISGARDAAADAGLPTHARQRHGVGRLRALWLAILLLLLVVAGIAGALLLIAPSRQHAAPSPGAASQARNPYTRAGTLVLNDALNGRRNLYGWDEKSGGNGAGCFFSRDAYHVTEPSAGFFHGCLATAPRYSDFVFQVRMTLLGDGAGGLLFRTDLARSQAYYFSVNAAGSYALWAFDPQGGKTGQRLTRAGSVAADFHAGQRLTNTLAVVAQGPALGLYINQQHLATFQDRSLASGQIGVFAASYGAFMEAAYSDARVWLLP
jgi:hypothetical protein